jgi:hypothetical protein
MRKIVPISGVVRAEWVRCGKPTCRCSTGSRHGPYLYRRWRENGRQRRAYVGPGDAERVREATELWQQLHPPAYRLRQQLADLRSLVRDLED